MVIQFLFWSTNIQTKEMLHMQITHVKNWPPSRRTAALKRQGTVIDPYPGMPVLQSKTFFIYSNKSHWSQPRELTENLNTIYIFLGSVLSHSLHFVLFYVCTCMRAHRIQNSVSALKSRRLNSGSLLFTFVFWDLSQYGVQAPYSGSINTGTRCVCYHTYHTKPF